LQKLHELIKDDPRFVMIGISFDDKDDAERLGRFIAEKDLPWIHGLAGRNDSASLLYRTYGIPGTPAMLLIDNEDKVLLSNPNVEEVAKIVNDMKR
jgi:hypothetical protein